MWRVCGRQSTGEGELRWGVDRKLIRTADWKSGNGQTGVPLTALSVQTHQQAGTSYKVQITCLQRDPAVVATVASNSWNVQIELRAGAGSDEDKHQHVDGLAACYTA